MDNRKIFLLAIEKIWNMYEDGEIGTEELGELLDSTQRLREENRHHSELMPSDLEEITGRIEGYIIL